MLKPEDARKQLAEWKSADPKINLKEVAETLPKSVRNAYLLLHGYDSAGKKLVYYWDAERGWHYELAGVSVADRKRLFQAVFKELAPHVENAWRFVQTLPYTQGYARRPFRAPGRPDAYEAIRGSFVYGLLQLVHEAPSRLHTPAGLAAWAVFLSRPRDLAILLASVISQGGPEAEEVLAILKESATNEHEIGGMGSHVSRALLACPRPDAWEFMGKLLLAAQRQEGLRQTILEAVDEAHPGAFLHFLKLIREEDLVRFSAVVRAVGVWLGRNFDALTPAKTKQALESIENLLRDRAARTRAIDKGAIDDCRTALWCCACEDAVSVLDLAPGVLGGADAERRIAMIELLTQTGLPELMELYQPHLDDADLRVVATALAYYQAVPLYGDSGFRVSYTSGLPVETCHFTLSPNLFERFEQLVATLPETPKTLKDPDSNETGRTYTISQASAADLLLRYLGDRSPERLIPHLASMSPYAHVQALYRIAEKRPFAPAVRQLLLDHLNHSNEAIRLAVVELLQSEPLSEPEIEQIEGYLERKAEKIRLSVFQVLLKQSDEQVLASIARLMSKGEINQRLAGIELGRQMQVARRRRQEIHERMVAYHASAKRLNKAEADALAPLLVPPTAQVSLDDCLGLIDPTSCTPIVKPVRKDVAATSPASANLLRSLDAFIHLHKDKTFTTEFHGHKQEHVLGDASPWWSALPAPRADLSAKADRKNLPLLSLWEQWWRTRADDTRDADGLELVRAQLQPTRVVREGEEDAEFVDSITVGEPTEQVDIDLVVMTALEPLTNGERVSVRYPSVITTMLAWFGKFHPPKGAADYLLDYLETALALVPTEAFASLLPSDDPAADRTEWRRNVLDSYVASVASRQGTFDWSKAHDVRLFQLLHWLDQPVPGASRHRPSFHVLQKAYEAKGANLTDIVEDLLGPRPDTRGSRYYYGGTSFTSFQHITLEEGFREFLDKRPEVREAAARAVARVLEVELGRGEAPTAATGAANAISSLKGAETLFRLLSALGKSGFSRKFESWRGPGENRGAVFTRLVRVTQPLPTDAPADFAKRAKQLVKEGLVPQSMFVELALLNPYWLSHVEEALGWPGFSEAVWWFIAHTSNPFDVAAQAENGDEDEGSESDKVAKRWQAIVKARTNLTPEQRQDGVVDVAWFHRAYAALGNAKRWDLIEEASKFLKGAGQGHKKAARLADVLLGTTKKKDLVAGIRQKNLKEYVRLLGLLPLPSDDKKRQAELHERYKVLKEYERYAKTLSSLTKEPALRAARLGLENLAVTAGLDDPMRLEWHVSAATVADLLDGPVTVAIKEVAVTLSLNAMGEPELAQTKKGQPIKALPPEVKKAPKVAELFERRTDLKRLASSTKVSLETAMCRCDPFSGQELQTLMGHAIVRPLLERLVVQAANGAGYPIKNGKALEDYRGKTIAVKPSDSLLIAHPLHLLEAKDWHHWQKDCFARERLQPFKQIFREIYVANAQEQDEGDRSRRYAGHQLNPQQAMALFGQRGWSTREGIEKLYRDEGIIAEVYFQNGYTTPADVESPTLELVGFRKRDTWQLMPLKKVPKVIFSEVMRDLDLVVSVAHVGGVDPEATASTVEMRGALLKETFALLAIKNVKLESRHALIKGKLGHYSVHLGSGVVHKLPGGAVCIVPVHAQHRGRLFLPFADNDPKTAEVVSKVLLLARDHEIQDPTILEQIAKR